MYECTSKVKILIPHDESFLLVSAQMILWRDKPQTGVGLNETERKSKGPLGIHVRHPCA